MLLWWMTWLANNIPHGCMYCIVSTELADRSFVLRKSRGLITLKNLKVIDDVAELVHVLDDLNQCSCYLLSSKVKWLNRLRNFSSQRRCNFPKASLHLLAVSMSL